MRAVVRPHNVRILLSTFVLAMALPSAVVAQPSPGDAVPSSALQTEVADQEQPPEDEPRRGWRFQWDDHPSLRFGRDTRIDFRARFQAHVSDSQAATGDLDTVDLARRRVGLDGRIAGIVDFQVEGELGDDDPWRDVYADYRQFTAIRVQAGQFKLPFSLDENTSPTDLDFVYRSRAAAQLAPGRDWGVMTHGRVARNKVEYEIGWFNRDGDNARINNPGRVSGNGTLAARISVQPLRLTKPSPLRDLHVGVAWTESDVPEGFAAIRGRTALDASFFPADVWVKGQRRRTGLEARWQPGPFSVKAEYIRVSTERREQSAEYTDLLPLIASGWYMSGTWVATGEGKAAGLDRPRRSILRGGVGTIELAARIEALAFRSQATGVEPSRSPRAEVIAGNRDRVVTFGVNWYACRGIKIQANAMHDTIANATAGPLPSKPGFWSVVLRFQLTI